MESWIAAVRNCYVFEYGALPDKLSFDFYGFAEKSAKLLFAGKDCAAYSWKSGADDYLFAAGRGEKASIDELQDKLENVFDKLLGVDGDAILYAARYLAIDDMQGLEVCGETPLDGIDTVFYGLYLSDDKEGFYFTGFGNAEAEFVFDELTGAARHFYRKPEPATIYKGKSEEPFFASLRALACELLPDKQIDWNIFNATFLVDGGSFETRPAIIILNEGKAITYKQDDIYNGKDFGEIAASFLSNLPSLYDISGFTVTNFKDGRYGLTYYPLNEDDSFPYNEEADHKCGDNCEHEHNHSHDAAKDPFEALVCGRDDFKDLDSMIDELSVYMIEVYPGDWKCGMGLVTAFDEGPALLSFHTCCGPYIKTELKTNGGSQDAEKLDKLGEILENHYPGWNAFAFSFIRGEDGKADLKSLRDEAFNFDVFIDAEDSVYEDDEYMLPIADYFKEEFHNEDFCVSYVTFKIALGEDGLFVVEPATAGTDKGVIRVESFNKYLPKIYSIAEDIFEDYEDCNTISVTIFPERKFGFYLEYTLSQDMINRRNFPTVLREKGLSKYENALLLLARDEFTAIIYEVEVETSLLQGVSKIGGSADLPVDFTYPMTEDEKLFEFIAQINLEEIAPFDKAGLLPGVGLLSFFFDRNSGNCKVFYFKGENLEMRSIPEDGGVEDIDEYLPARLRFIPAVSLPITGRDIAEDFFENMDDQEKYLGISECFGKVKMFGYPDGESVANPGKDTNEQFKLLLQVPSVPECDMEWGKVAGTLYFWIKEDDLKLLRFDKCFCVLGEGKEDMSF